MGSLLQVSSSRLSKRTCLTRSLQYDKVNSFHTEATWMSRSIPCDIRTQDEASTAWLSRQPLCRGCMKVSIYPTTTRQSVCLFFDLKGVPAFKRFAVVAVLPKRTRDLPIYLDHRHHPRANPWTAIERYSRQRKAPRLMDLLHLLLAQRRDQIRR